MINNQSKEPNPQRVAEVTTGRLFKVDEEGTTFERKQQATAYLQQLNINTQVREIVKNAPAQTQTVRYEPDDSRLFTKDGHYESDEDNVDRTLYYKGYQPKDTRENPNDEETTHEEVD